MAESTGNGPFALESERKKSIPTCVRPARQTGLRLTSNPPPAHWGPQITLCYLTCTTHCCCFFKHLYWSIIALQWCVSFCVVTKSISYTYTYIPISLPSCISLPPSLSHPSRWSTKHRADLPVLCSCFPLAIYFTLHTVLFSKC